MDGIIVINKPQGFTSHDVVAKVRKKLNFKKIGHAGTLDPLATGVLVLLLGKSTKLFDAFVGYDKAYKATLILGTTTDSADTQGHILKTLPYESITVDQINAAFKKFQGALQQLPPMVSAVKHKGKKLYELARKGLKVERQPRDIIIHRLSIDEIQIPKVKFSLDCSKGTYVRQLAEDIGEALGCGACICQIERTKVGPFSLEQAVTLEEFNESHIRHWQG
ncbi:MAG: tRNA pseudouridine(55) synthase TruB [Candidatus Omnitrophica bacterium]|nr:tRNA pseudouridine(55) synthase TruB [Candidatus Omnitrophota bacterium]